MKNKRKVLGIAAATLLLAAPAFSQGEVQGQGQAIVTILPKHGGESAGHAFAPDVRSDMSLKVDGKVTQVTSFTPLRDSQDGLELVVLIDGSARTSLGRQMDDIAHFVQSLPPNAKVAIGYMENGRAAMAGPLTADHAQALRGLHLPVGSAGSNGSPYFCLSDLAKHWPSQDSAVRREVLMVTDGVDEYSRRYDPDDPYVQAAMTDSVKAGLVVYAIYWQNQGIADRTMYENNAGQNLLLQVTQATGGTSFWEGLGNPVSFQPFLDEFNRRLRNQYELSFAAPLKGKSEVEQMKLKFSVPGSEVDAPQEVFVGRPAVAQNQ
jgi:hypothetical protein